MNFALAAIAHPGRIWLLLAAFLLFSVPLAVSAQSPDSLGSVQGSVRDAHGAPVAKASVSLQDEKGTQIQIISADEQGAYRFSGVKPGTYTLHARSAGFDGASSGSFVVGQGELKTVDVTLRNLASGQTASKPALPEFSDEPNFTVAGVADTTNLGGHGSDVVVRNREGLAKATASLGAESPASQPPASLVATEKSLRAALERDRAGYEANYRLGKLLVEEGRAREAISYLEHASQTKAGVYENEYELALAHCSAGDYEIAAGQARALLARQDKAELHHLLAEIEERRNHPLEAVQQYQRAAELNASESNYFDWGAELLLHQAPEPAIEVFSKGSRLFPGSVRMLTALGAAWYARGSYDQAVQTLCRASDLDPHATAPYMFLGKIQNAENGGNPEIVASLARFARLQPANAWANYYYAVSLWKQRKGPDDNENLPVIESLLQTAIRVDPTLGAAYLQLGILYSDQKSASSALAAYQKAAASAPDLPDAHYRLAQAYRQAGDKTKAQQELQLYQQTSQKAAEEVERERHEVRQFVYKLRDQTPTPRPE